ncbi:MAG: CerR family C-terminal domain-containing protein [Desulfovibrio sp.]
MKKNKTPEETRKSLLDAGLVLFGEHGFKSVTTRMLAQEAGVNQAAIPYHFNGKEGLYLAVAEYAAETILVRTHELYTAYEENLGGGLSKKECAVRIARHLQSMLSGMVGLEEQRRFVRFIYQEYMNPGQGFHIIYNRVILRNHMALSALVAVMMDVEIESDEAIVRTHAIAGQIMGVVAARVVLLKRLGRDQFTKADIQLLYKSILEMSLLGFGLDRQALQDILEEVQ